MEQRIAFRFVALERKDGKAPSRVMLLRDGNLGWLGLEEMELDEKAAANVIDQFKKVGNKLPIDYHHATVQQEQGKTDKAPAAGWVTDLEYIAGEGLYGNVEWTAQATKEIEAEEYKYISPVVNHTDVGEIVQLHSVALTNRPRTMDQVELLKAADRLAAHLGDQNMTGRKVKTVTAQDEPDDMAPAVNTTQKLLAQLIGALQEKGSQVADEAPLNEVLQATIEALTGGAVEEEVVEEAAAAESTADKTEQVEAKAEDTPKPGSDDDVETCAMKIKAQKFDEMNDRVKVLEADRKADRVDALVEAQIEAGNILPDDKKMVTAARTLAEKDEDQFKLIFGAMTPLCEPGRLTSASGGPAKTPRLKLIKAAQDEFAKDPNPCGAKERYYVGAYLDEHDEPDLTEDEVKALSGAKA